MIWQLDVYNNKNQTATVKDDGSTTGQRRDTEVGSMSPIVSRTKQTVAETEHDSANIKLFLTVNT